MNRASVIKELELIAPPSLAEDFDAGKIGLIIEGSKKVDNIASSLDATPGVVAEAVRIGSDMLVVHHTPIWFPVTKVSGHLQEVLLTALSSDLNIYVMHTNFDHAPGGINDALADLLDMKNREDMSIGLVGDCDLKTGEIRERLGCGLRIYGEGSSVDRLAVAGGSCFTTELLMEAEELGAEALLSSELKHGVMLSSPITCIEATHYALESPGMKALASRMNWPYIDAPPGLITIP